VYDMKKGCYTLFCLCMKGISGGAMLEKFKMSEWQILKKKLWKLKELDRH